MGSSPLENVLRRLKGCKPSGPNPNQYVACCPAHADAEQSLAVSVGDNGAVLFKCFAGCTTEQILEALDMEASEMYPDDAEPRAPRSVRAPKYPPEKWEERAAVYAEKFQQSTVARPLLAKSLDLPETAFDLFPLLGARADHRDGSCWTFPERDAGGRIVGLGLRFRDGAKKMDDGGNRGLSVPTGWRERPGPLYLPEGPSDTIALSFAGLAAVGRPGLDCKLRVVADFLRAEVSADRPVIWLGENDAKEKTVAASRAACEKLARTAERPVQFCMVPAPHKDARAWLVAATTAGEEWPAAGDRFAAALVPCDSRARIRIGTNNEKEAVNDAAIAALAHDPEVFARGPALVTVIDHPASAYRGCQFPPAPRISPLSMHVIRERLELHADFYTFRDEKEVSIIPPDRVVCTVRDRQVWPGMKCIEAVVEYPVIRPDGTVVTARGYDDRTGVYYAPSGDPPPVPDAPTRVDALAAWDVVQEMVCDFPFAGDAHRASWLAALLTPPARFAFRGPAPLFLIEANVPGAGKGLLADTIAIPLTGQEFACSAYTAIDEEMQKRITTIAVEGDKVVLLDNITGQFGGPTIDLMLTSVRWTGRILGSNTSANLPLWATWYGTGNNLQFVGDVLRRICPCRLVSPIDKPEERENFTHENLRAWVRANRPRILGAILTILRAYFVAGSPRQPLKPWGSYEEWSRVVRSTVVWLGLPDPANARQEVRTASDNTRGAMETIVLHFHLLDPDRKGITCGQILALVKPDKPLSCPSGLADVSEAIDSLMPNRATAAGLGRCLLAYRERRIDGRYIDFVSRRSHTTRWGVFADSDVRDDGGVVGSGGNAPHRSTKLPLSSSLFTGLTGRYPTNPHSPPPSESQNGKFSDLDD